MSKTPYEIRLEILRIAKELVTEDFYSKKEQIFNEWEIKKENSKKHDTTIPDYPKMDEFPSEDKIIAKAVKLKKFVDCTD